MQNIREMFERHQVGVYFGAVVVAAFVAFLVPGTAALEGGVNPALAFMLFVTFLQVPLADLGRAFGRGRFPCRTAHYEFRRNAALGGRTGAISAIRPHGAARRTASVADALH